MVKNIVELSTSRLLVRSTIRLGIGILLLAVTLFLSFGSFDWPMVWVYLGLVVVGMSITTALLARTEAALLRAVRVGGKAPFLRLAGITRSDVDGST